MVEQSPCNYGPPSPSPSFSIYLSPSSLRASRSPCLPSSPSPSPSNGKLLRRQKLLLPAELEESSDDELDLPYEDVKKIMKRAFFYINLPPDSIISDEAVLFVQSCAREFILLFCTMANNQCKDEGRDILTGNDLLHCWSLFGLKQYVEHLVIYRRKYKEFEATQQRVANKNGGSGTTDVQKRKTFGQGSSTQPAAIIGQNVSVGAEYSLYYCTLKIIY